VRDLFDAPWFFDGYDDERKVTMSECEKDVVPKYRGNPLVDFEAGVGLDLRVKLACELLKSSPLFTVSINPAEDARRALDTASELLDLAAARGLVYSVPEDDGLSAPLKRHISRNARAAVYQHHAQQRAAREESGGVMPAGASVFPGMHG
jgi:hypothetical protein